VIFRTGFLFVCLLVVIACSGRQSGAAEKFFMDEQFESLENWEPFYFPNIKRHSRYAIIKKDGESWLQAESSASASAIMYQKSFDVYRYRHLKWRWKVDNIYQKGDAEKKSGDDYPLRIYVMFQYEPQKAGFLEKITYNAARLIYGAYPPYSTLNYIWANKNHQRKIVKNRYTDRARMILLEMGDEHLNQWRDYKVDILKDYREAFGEDPPARARIAIMNDSDDTGESSRSQVDYIQLYGERIADR